MEYNKQRDERKRKEGKSIKIEYIQGISKGLIHWIKKDIARDLIKTGVAKEIK